MHIYSLAHELPYVTDVEERGREGEGRGGEEGREEGREGERSEEEEEGGIRKSGYWNYFHEDLDMK